MSPIETQRTSSPENILLEKLKSTLTARWQDFDRQLPAGKFVYPAYVNIKSSYEGLLADLRTTFTDDALKHDSKIQGKIDTFLVQLNKYLQKEDRDKKYDATLTETNRLVSELRNQIYAQTIAETQQKAADLKQDVVASAPKSTPESKPESLPTTTQAAATVAAVGSTGVVAAVESGGKKAEEAAKTVMKPLEKIKKWSSDIGSAWDAGWELVKKGDISKGIGLFFAVLFGGNLKDALAKYAGKKDETKPAETKAEQVPSAEKKESEEIEKNKLKRNEAVKLLVNLNASESSENDQAQMQTFLRNPEFTKLPLSAIGPMFASSGYKLTDSLKKTLEPSISTSGIHDPKIIESALKCLFSKDGLVAGQMQQVYRRIQEKNNQNATIEQGILGAYGSLGIFMKLADRRAGDVDIDIGIHVNPQTGEITGGAKDIIGGRLSKESLLYIVHTNAGGVVPKSSTDIHLQSEDKLDEKSRKEVIDFIDFTTKIRSNYATIFGKQIQDSEITSIIKNNLDNISYGNAIKMYALLDGNNDPTKMLDAQKFGLLMLLGNIGDSSKNTSQFNTYMLEQGAKQTLGKTSDLPESFSKYAELFLKKTWSAAKGVASTSYESWLGIGTQNPILAGVALTAFVLSLRWTKTTGIESLIPSIKK